VNEDRIQPNAHCDNWTLFTNRFPHSLCILYTVDSITEESLEAHENDRMKGGRRMNSGLKKTIGEDTECPGMGSNQI
jgi:hypothetical protein